MEEKKEIKVSLGTVVCIFIILVLVVALAGMYFYYNNKLDSNKEIYKNTELDNNITEKQLLENVNNNQDGEDYETTGKRLFEQYLQGRKELVDYKINSCKMVSYYNNEFICKINYDVKVEGKAENSDWIAGNGEPEGNWIKGKNVFLSFKKINGVYTYNEDVGQMTGWDISYFENKEVSTEPAEENIVSSKTEKEKIESNITDISDIEKLLKNQGNHEYLKIQNIKEDNDKYLVEADYYVPTPITEKEYSEMVNNKKIILNNKEYIFDNSNEVYNTGYGYVYIEGQHVESGYWIEKTNEGYIFIHEIGGVFKIINEIKEHYLFYLDKNIEVAEVAGGSENVDLNKYLAKNENLANFFTTVVYDKYDNELRVVIDKR